MVEIREEYVVQKQDEEEESNSLITCIGVCFSYPEKRRIRALAKREGLTLSKYLRVYLKDLLIVQRPDYKVDGEGRVYEECSKKKGCPKGKIISCGFFRCIAFLPETKKREAEEEGEREEEREFERCVRESAKETKKYWGNREIEEENA